MFILLTWMRRRQLRWGCPVCHRVDSVEGFCDRSQRDFAADLRISAPYLCA
jgi:hypothetical protein